MPLSLTQRNAVRSGYISAIDNIPTKIHEKELAPHVVTFALGLIREPGQHDTMIKS